MPVTLEGFLLELEHIVDEPVRYQLRMQGGETLPLNELLGHCISIRYRGEKRCRHCGRRVSKLYQNGYCFPCVSTLAECDLCIVKPHECHFHRGTCRDEEFGRQQCMVPHYVYLAWSSGVKVGLTRKGREYRRWVDQGAIAAIRLAELPTRREAGQLEVEIAKYLSDKTDWRRMLKEEARDVDLAAVKRDLFERVQADWRRCWLIDDDTVYRFDYPRLPSFEPQTKVLGFHLRHADENAPIEGRLSGIKGQYLLLDTGVFHVQRHTGYRVQVAVS